MTGDVVAELDRWLEQWDSGYFVAAPSLETIPLLRRARDEIVALRGLLEHSDRTVITAVAVATPVIRNEALEEAARRAEHYEAPIWSVIIARAIRALKEKH